MPGEDWDESIQERLANAQLILFLVSRQFLASEYISNKERPLAMTLKESGKAVIVPILLSACNWHLEDFAKLENLPDKGRLVADIHPHEKAWTMVETGIKKAVEKFRTTRKFTDVTLKYARDSRTTGFGEIGAKMISPSSRK